MTSFPQRALRQVHYRLRTRIQNLLAKVNERPVFVIGNQKSGTSAIVSLLAAAAGKSATNDIFTWYSGVESDVINGRIDFLEFVEQARHHFSRDFVKDPSFTFMLPALRARFPDARYVFVVRDPRLNIRGILNRVDVPGTVTDLDTAMTERIRRERRGWLPVLEGQGLINERSLVSRLAHRSRIAMEIAASESGQWPVVRYEDFITDKTGTIAATLHAIGETVANDIAADADRPFQPPSRDRSEPKAFFSSENLADIETICRPMMEVFSYK